jgi:MATE family multidrug resistance protein
MVLSSSAVTLMQLVDALVLSRHSQAAVAAMGPASLMVILVQGLLFGTSGYAGTFAAHHFGAKDESGLRRSAALGLRFSLRAGLAALLLAWPLAAIFRWSGHAPAVVADEISYASICLAGSFFPVLGAAFAGWLSGIGKPGLVTATSFLTLVVNAALAWGLVLGRGGLPHLGMAGAAWATVIAQALGCAIYAVLLVREGAFSVAADRRVEAAEFRRFLRLAFPLGLRISGEVFAWTAFLVFLGRIGQAELAASSIAFRINGAAFFPAMGLGQAAGVLVGQARGAGRDDDVPSIGWQATALCELWLAAMAAVFLAFPGTLVGWFAGSGPQAASTIHAGVVILRFVSFYCLFDAGNVVLGWALSSAGDTAWIARTFALFSAVFVACLVGVDRFAPGIAAEWSLATIFVAATALTWAVRFHRGSWRTARVVGESSLG